MWHNPLKTLVFAKYIIAYPELKDWEFGLEQRPQYSGAGGYTDRANKEVFASAPESSGGYYGSGSRMQRASGGDKRDLPAVLSHELTHTTLGGLEGFPNQGGNPEMVALGSKFRRIWGGRDDPISDALGMPGFAAHMNYEAIPGEWLARRVQDRSGMPAEDLRRVPFIDNELIGTESLPVQQAAFPKRKRGEAPDAYTKRYDEYQSENTRRREGAKRYPGETGWTEPTTDSDILAFRF